jgi:hypothetical protein
VRSELFALERRIWGRYYAIIGFRWKAYSYPMNYDSLDKLQQAGAKLEVFINGNKESMRLLLNWINTITEITDDKII